MIWVNFFRDLRSTAARLVSVTIITAIAVLVYTALADAVCSVERIADDYFAGQNAADYWIAGADLDAGDCRALARLDGVTGVQPRVVWDGAEKGDSDSTLALFGVPRGYAINTPYLTAGALPADSREILLSDEFARARGLAVGDVYELTLTGTGRGLRLRVSGLAKSPECLYHVNATTPSPDLARYGFAYVDEGALEGLLGPGRYNQICITTRPGTDADGLRAGIRAALGDKVVSVLARADNPQAYSLLETKENIAVIVQVFPILFFLCAVLMMVSTMNRIIESARTTVGTFKALGYGDGAILRYYLFHALLVVAAGFALGAFLGRFVTRFLVEALAMGCDLPPYTVARDGRAWAEALGLTALCCLGSAWLVARALIRESPAQCMRPRPPRSVRPVLLERFPRLWRRLGFSEKYIVRSTLRNKVRMLTCVVGIAFCMALVLLAFALQDSLGHYAHSMADNQHRYDLMADLSAGVTRGQYARLAGSPHAAAAEFEMSTACWLYAPDRLTTASLTVAEDTTALKLYDPYAPAGLTLPSEGMVLEEALAQTLGVGAGDSLRLRFSGDSRFYTVRVAEVNRGVTGAYVGRSFWRGLGRPFTPTAAYLAADDRAALERELDGYDFVDGWQTREAVTAAVVERMESASLVVYILIVFGGALACVVIYNLGIMSFYEQIRSLATLMVLGFHDREIRRLQLSENLIFAGAGICLGIPIGAALNEMIIRAITTMPLEAATQPRSLVLSCAVTMLFALAVNFVIGRKMGDIDMLGALKSVE